MGEKIYLESYTCFHSLSIIPSSGYLGDMEGELCAIENYPDLTSANLRVGLSKWVHSLM